MPLMQAESMDKGFPGVHALDHVDFDHCEMLAGLDQWRRRGLGVRAAKPWIPSK
jgi:hypothetical protein